MQIDKAPEALGDINAAADAIGADFWPVNQRIHDNPELAWYEFIAHDALTGFMETQPGWKVKRSVYGIDTAWIAEFDSGVPGPVVSFNAEYGVLQWLFKGHWLILNGKTAYQKLGTPAATT